jgi:GxxExxY protein
MMLYEHGDHGAHGGEMKRPNEITEAIIGGAIKVHRELSAGLLESAYEACLAFELVRSGHVIERQKRMPIAYDGLAIDEGYRIDLLVDNEIIVELKAVARLEDVHEAQLLSYVRLAKKPVGLLINFNVPRLAEGVRRVVNGPHQFSP